VVESLRSILPFCDEVVVNVGTSEDATLELVRGIRDPKIRILETEWDFSDGPSVLRAQTLRAMRACRHAWGIYIQADEVLHESGGPLLRAAIAEADPDPRALGVVVRYRHFYGSPFVEATSRKWYRREIRAVRLDPKRGVEPYRDAQGFRVEPGHLKVPCLPSEAEMFHYGWTRSARALNARRLVDQTLYPGRTEASHPDALLPWIPGLRAFRGSHPAAAKDWVARRAVDPDRTVAARRFRPSDLWIHASGLIEAVTGARLLSFRNYRLLARRAGSRG